MILMPRAKELLEKALVSAEKNFGGEHPATEVRYSNLALVLKVMNHNYSSLSTTIKIRFFRITTNIGVYTMCQDSCRMDGNNYNRVSGSTPLAGVHPHKVPRHPGL